MAFPEGPYTDGQTHTEGGVGYTYNAEKGVWDRNFSPGDQLTIVDNADGTFAIGDAVIDTRVLSATTLPASGAYANQIAECAGKLFKWVPDPGIWVQVG